MSKTNVIEWTNVGPDDLVWACPYEDIRWGSVVVVHEYETAIFMRDGKVYDVLNPGRHTLNTQNIPLLTRAYRLVMGYGETPFKATIIYVALKQFRGNFGVNTRIALAPSSLGWRTECQAHGNYFFRASEPVLFLTQLVGAVGKFATLDVSNFIRSFFSQEFASELATYSASEIFTKQREVTQKIKAGILYEGFKQRGLELVDIKLEGIQTPDLDKLGKEDPTYGAILYNAIMKGNDTEAARIMERIETMRALGKSPATGIWGAMIAVPQALGQQPPQPAYQQQSQPQPSLPPNQPVQAKTPLERLRELKQMLDEGLITQEEFEASKKQILGEVSKG
jgi:membrane protease subunit (stomatin/prohibitin family)